jgi:DNA-binding response OmpR family regulator
METNMNRYAILVVEDDTELGDVITFILREAGFETELVRDGATAFKRISEQRPDLVMLDLHLPNVSGVEILNAIRSDPRLLKTRIMVTTADTRLARACEGKVDQIFVKPYSVGDLIASVAHLSTSV